MMDDARKVVIIFLSLLGALVGLFLIYQLSGILTPFVVAFVLAYMFNPLVNLISENKKYRLPRLVGVLLVLGFLFGLLFLLLLWFIPLLAHQVSALVSLMPVVVDWVQEVFLPYLQKNWGLPVFNWSNSKAFVLGQSDQIKNILGWAGSATLQSGLFLTGFLVNLGILCVVLFYIMRDWAKITLFLKRLGGKKNQVKISRIATRCDSVLSAFFRGQLSVMLALGVVYSIGLALIGVEFSLLIGMLSGIFSIVPYLGGILGLILGTLVAWFQFHDMIPVLWVVGLCGLGQALEGMIFTPYFVGNKLGLHPVAVIFAVMAGGQLFGFVGILVALPVAAVLIVMAQEIK